MKKIITIITAPLFFVLAIPFMIVNLFLALFCAASHGKSCARLGDFYLQGIGVRQDKHRALYWHQKACDAEHKESCDLLDYYYENTDE